MSPSQNKDVHDNNSTPIVSNPPEGKTTAVIAVMRGNPKDGFTRLCSNKHCKQRIVRVLLDSGSDCDLIFVSKDKPMLLPFYSKRLVPQSWDTLNGIFQMRRKTRAELNFFEYSNRNRFYAEPDVVEYDKVSKLQYDLILGTETMKEFSIILNFRDKMIAIDEVILPMRNINNLHSSIFCALKHNHSLAMEPQSTQDATQHATWILNAKYSKADLQSVVRDNCKPLSANQQKKLLQQLKRYELLFYGTLGSCSLMAP